MATTVFIFAALFHDSPTGNMATVTRRCKSLRLAPGGVPAHALPTNVRLSLLTASMSH